MSIITIIKTFDSLFIYLHFFSFILKHEVMYVSDSELDLTCGLVKCVST